MKKELHAILKGKLQGVGFRRTAQRYAQDLSITGFAHNLTDGSVELVAQGEEVVLKEFMTALQGSFKIEHASLEFKNITHPYSDFTIR